MGSESTPRSKLADTTHDTELRPTEAPITDRDGAPVDRHGADLAPGTIVGDYQIERKLGHGGMGSVYEAIHPVIEKRVAIKVLLPELSRNDEAVERFKSEARAVNRIRHPAIVDVFGYGTTEDGRCFLVMELLDGESLGRRLQYDAPAIAEACDILIAITHALDAAHATGIVHRDLKPDNVFLVEHKHVKLLDFGIAKLTSRPETAVSADYTQPGQAMGTPRYIAPEQARGDAVDGRTDIYSLGVMAFELLVGRPPFVGDNAMELIAKHIAVPPPTPSDLAPTLPPAADRLLLQMLDKEPVNRPTLSVVRAMLDEIRAPWVTAVNDTAVGPIRPITAVETHRVAPAVDTAPIPRRTRWWIPLAIIATLGTGVGAFALVRAGRGEDASPPPPRGGARSSAPLAAPAQPPAAPAKPERKPEEPKPEEAKPEETKPDEATSEDTTTTRLEPTEDARPAPKPSKPSVVRRPPPPKPTPKPPTATLAPKPTPTPPVPPPPPPPKPAVGDDGLITPPFLRKP